MKSTSSYVALIFSVLILFSIGFTNTNMDQSNQKSLGYESENKSNNGRPVTTNCLLMYELLEKYSQKHNIPKYIAYNIAFKETRYKGPFDWDYNPELISSAGAQGPMQVMPSTAKLIQGEVISAEDLRTDIELNIETSMMLLEKLYHKYGDWKIVCGCYNTGQPIVNDYAIYCSTNKDYRSKWVYYK